MIESALVDVGFLGITGFGVWRGQTLWSHHIELKHEREMARLSMDRMEMSIRLEMDQNRALAEIESMGTLPALPVGESGFNPAWFLVCVVKATHHRRRPELPSVDPMLACHTHILVMEDEMDIPLSVFPDVQFKRITRPTQPLYTEKRLREIERMMRS